MAAGYQTDRNAAAAAAGSAPGGDAAGGAAGAEADARASAAPLRAARNDPPLSQNRKSSPAI